jgi:hypothetical protein
MVSWSHKEMCPYPSGSLLPQDPVDRSRYWSTRSLASGGMKAERDHVLYPR